MLFFLANLMNLLNFTESLCDSEESSYLCRPQNGSMNPFAPYRIPFIGLKTGVHSFEFELDDTFFASFEHSEIARGNVQVRLSLEKQSSMMVLDFELDGEVEGSCDRCGDPMDVEVMHEDRLIVKFGDETGDPDDEILVFGPAEHILELQQYLYEYAHLGLPARMAHESEEECNQEAIARLKALEIGDDDSNDDDDDVDPRWEALKKLK